MLCVGKKEFFIFFFFRFSVSLQCIIKKQCSARPVEGFPFKMRYFIEIIQFLVRGSLIATGKMGKKIIFRGSRNILVTHGT